jgi:GxxExxY protein
MIAFEEVVPGFRGLEIDDLSNRVIGCAVEVHRELGPGLLESVYESCLAHELGLNGIRFNRQHPVPVDYKGMHVACGCHVDLLVEGRLIVELERPTDPRLVHETQLLTRMRLTGVHSALLINFNVPRLMSGIKRFVR